MDIGHFWANFGMGLAEMSLETVDNVFGSNDTANAVREFAVLVQREYNRVPDLASGIF